MSRAVGKALYQPVSLLFSVLGGLAAGAVFSRIWKLTGQGADVPKPASLERGTAEVLLAAMLHGMVFGVVKALVDRAGARGYRWVTGADPRT